MTGKPIDMAQRCQKKELVTPRQSLLILHLHSPTYQPRQGEGPTPIPMESLRIGLLWPAGAGRPQ